VSAAAGMSTRTVLQSKRTTKQQLLLLKFYTYYAILAVITVIQCHSLLVEWKKTACTGNSRFSI